MNLFGEKSAIDVVKGNKDRTDARIYYFVKRALL